MWSRLFSLDCKVSQQQPPRGRRSAEQKGGKQHPGQLPVAAEAGKIGIVKDKDLKECEFYMITDKWKEMVKSKDIELPHTQ